MLFEYAVEPQAIGSSWQSFRYLIEKFGFDRGRLISRLPGKWEREVYAAAAHMKPTERARLEIALSQAKQSKFLRSGRPYDHALGSWSQNAIAQDAVAPFHAIIAEQNPACHPRVITVDEADEQHPLMAVAQDRAVARDAKSIADALSGLLCVGARILFVDPFFDPYNARFRNTLRECLAVVKSNNQEAACEIHYRYHKSKPSNIELEKEAANLFNGVVPEGITVSVYCWKEKSGGADFHARYLLTEKGGIGIDAGFSAEGRHQSTDMHLMSLVLSAARLNSYKRNASDFDLVEPVLVIHSDGTIHRG